MNREQKIAQQILSELRKDETLYNRIVEFSKTGKSYERYLTTSRDFPELEGFLNFDESDKFDEIVNNVDDSLSGFAFKCIMSIVDKTIKS